MSNMLEDLKKYFRNTPSEQIMKDWAETQSSDNIGPTVEEFLQKTKTYFKLEEPKIDWISLKVKSDNINPKYSSGFLLCI